MKICIDPGHGGSDPGAIGPTGLREADVNLRAALLLKSMLVARGVDVVLTRSSLQALSSDKTTDLRMRASTANEQKCNLFISLHCNSFSDPDAAGSETWYYAGSSGGERYARIVQPALVSAGKRHDRGIKETKNLAVLRYTSMPAILVELAFISNPEEENLLRDGWWLSQVTSALARAVTSGSKSQAAEEAELLRLFRGLDQTEQDRILALLVDMTEKTNPS